jgi:large subunit ribosomal protein L6
MSKIGRLPINIGSAQVEIDGQTVRYKGSKESGVYELPDFIKVELLDKKLKLTIPKNKRNRETNIAWGLHRALLANAIKGVDKGFEKQLQIIGLGYKAALSGNKIVLSLGYSHKIDIPLPKGISLEIDKTGQLLTFRSHNRALLGELCDQIRSCRPPEPYKGTGIRYASEEISRKAGKAKVTTTS